MSEETSTEGAEATETAGSTNAATAETTTGEVQAETDWVAEARKWEKRAKDHAARLKDAEPKLTEYERLVEASKSDQERLQERAEQAESRATGMLRDVATAKLEAALTGVVPDVAAFLEDLNVDKFIADGVIDTEAITALRTKYAAFTPVDKPGMKPNPAQGRSASPSPTIAQQLAQAQEAGDIKAAFRIKAAQQLAND